MGSSFRNDLVTQFNAGQGRRTNQIYQSDTSKPFEKHLCKQIQSNRLARNYIGVFWSATCRQLKLERPFKFAPRVPGNLKFILPLCSTIKTRMLIALYGAEQRLRRWQKIPTMPHCLVTPEKMRNGSSDRKIGFVGFHYDRKLSGYFFRFVEVYVFAWLMVPPHF